MFDFGFVFFCFYDGVCKKSTSERLPGSTVEFNVDNAN